MDWCVALSDHRGISETGEFEAGEDMPANAGRNLKQSPLRLLNVECGEADPADPRPRSKAPIFWKQSLKATSANWWNQM
jgi:hypothetical protein